MPGLLAFAQTLMPPPTARPAPPPSSDNSPPLMKDAATAPPPPLMTTADSSLLPATDGTAAIAQLQRTSVQYLGITSFASSPSSSSTAAAANRIQQRVKAAQDRVRIAGGLGLVLGMCQIDERNPSTFIVLPLLPFCDVWRLVAATLTRLSGGFCPPNQRCASTRCSRFATSSKTTKRTRLSCASSKQLLLPACARRHRALS